ncbi:LysR family transcriptional regulator [Halomonas urumqiensis]|uniref:LysR family transcriptional regulator n=1 Tax=Halomonas urumqiensis TaxID=1684789 RepID=A0A2N7UFA8_9GAMM|nr:LysR substrate-binding domain-containing protein [Halomonas urumqiensis]PMR79122.1 LysR family transcriptional regulator [Halomonas urumqiensis]PTB03797.1 LysR family transcriptional regulator [Halomonas urumqiensis]GHE19971.1 LysR family transcriptional regulator [Halomonas urumqiensis]
MKIEWIEDFLALIEAGTFSQAAARRHVTQPAFSRRIRQLEDWLGVELIDRHSPRLTLLPHAQAYEASLRDWLAHLYALRGRIRADARQGPRAILTTQHTLTVSYLPRLLRHFRQRAPQARVQVRSSDRSDCIREFQRGDADLLLCSELEGTPLRVEREGVERVPLGTEQLVPVCAADRFGQPIFDLEHQTRLPLIGYDPSSFLGSVLSSPYLLDLQRHYDVELVCETAFTIGIRELALAGLGIGWLPHGLIESELEAGNLVSLLEQLGGPMLVVACYRQPGDGASAADQLWELINARPPEV